MNKKINIPWIVSIALLFIAFNISFFMMTPIEKIPAMWVCYGFIVFAFVCAFITPLFNKNNKRTTLSLSLYFVTSIYLIVTIYLSYSMLSCSPIIEGLVYQQHIFALVIYVILFTICVSLNKRTNANVDNDNKEMEFIKNNYSLLKDIELNVSDRETLKKLNSLKDLLHSSPKKTNENVKSLEEEISDKIKALQDLNGENLNESIEEIEKLLSKRNNRLISKA